MTSITTWSWRAFIAMVAALLIVLIPAPPASAAGMTVTTTYPAIEVDPGGTATFPLTIMSTAPQRVDLTVDGVPEGYTASFHGEGSIVDSVFTSPTGKDAPKLEVQVKVPDTAGPGTTTLTVTARSGPETVTLPLDVRISDKSGGQVTLDARTPALRGTSSDDFSFSVALRNDTARELEFSFDASAPAGWTVDARPSGEAKAATAVVSAGGSATVAVTAKPPADAAAGAYPLVVTATGGSYSAQAQLAVELTGTYAMALTTADDRLNTQVTAGSSSNFALIVRNSGSAPLLGVSVTGTPPRDWKIDLTPSTIDAIPAGQSVPVTAVITPAGNAVAGDYAITFDARASGANGEGSASDTVNIRTTVETSSMWGFVGLGVIAVVVIGLLAIFRRYGRR